MIKLVKEDIDDIRYCVISRNRERKFYDVEEFCNSSLEARKLAKEYADSDANHRIHDTEYWAFDTKKWKALLPMNFMKDDQTFDSNLPIYHNDENGKAELLADYVGKQVNNYTGRWKKESYKKNIRENFELSEDELDLVYDIADRYNTSSPVSGDWDTETVHEMNAISDELGITPEEAKKVMIDYLGFEEDMFIESVKPVNEENQYKKRRKSLQKESESMMPDYTEDGSWCIWYYNEADAEFGHDPGPQIVEDNLTQEYAEARAEELNATCQPFEQYWAERERERYW